MADTVEDASVSKARVSVVTEPITEFCEQTRDGCAGVPRAKFLSITIGQLSRDAKIIIKIRNRQRPIRVERISLASVAAAADVKAKVRPITAPAFGRDIDYTREGVAAEYGCGSRENLDSFDVFDRYKIKIDRIKIGLINSDAIDEDAGRRNRLGVETSHIDGLLKLVTNSVVEHDAGLILQDFLHGLGAKLVNFFGGYDDNLPGIWVIGCSTSRRRVEFTNTGGSVASGGSAAGNSKNENKNKIRKNKQTLMETSFSRERGVVEAGRTGFLT